MRTQLFALCFFATLLFTLSPVQSLWSQNVNVTGALVGNGTYPTLGAAFTAINGGAQTGASIVVTVTGNTVEAATASLSQGTWATLIIIPAGGAARTITGAVVGPLVEFNSADRVAIDGLNSGGNSLTIENTAVGAASTLRFLNDARAIGVQNVTLLGATTSITMGTVLLDVGIGGGGNDSIVFNNAIISNSGANFPVQGVFSAGNVTAGQENSQVQFLGCQISNFFSATLLNRGIFVSTGNTDWTISNCRFFQTAARTYTTGNIHTIIRIASGNNHLVSGNILGFATALGTGTYTMNGAVTNRLIGIDLAVGTTTASSVQGNTITAINLATTSGAATTNGVLCGINVTSGSVNIGNIAGNIIGGASGTNLLVATPTSTQGAVVGIHSSSTGAHVISGNIMGGFTAQGSAAGIAGTVTGINISSTPSALSITNNVIGNATADNMIAGVLGVTTGSSLASGINLSGAIAAAATVTGNTIQNLSSYGTGTTGFVRGIWTGTAGASAFNISNNTVANLLTTNANTAVGNGQLGAMGIYVGAGTSPVINNNTITNVSNLNAGAVSTNVAGISHTNGTNTAISNNRIYGINNASTTTSTTLPGLACGVFVRGGANNLAIFNNMISLGIGQTSNTSFVGVIVYSGGGTPTVTQVLHNTIYIGGTAASGAQPTMCVSRGNYSLTAVTFPMDVRNNLLQNERTGGTGLHMAIANNLGATASATGWGANASNNNILNANAATVGFWTTAQTLAGWRTASAGDGASYTGAAVTFVNNATDLHLNMGVTPNLMESGGQVVGIATDIDGQARPGPAGSVNGGALSPDLGADEFDGVGLDILPPTITYTPLTFTCLTGDRTLTATITDISGVPISGAFQPRIYFRKNAGAYVSAQGVLSSGTATNGTWTFTISAAAMGGLVATDVVSYFVIAQDVATPTFFISSNPAAGLVATDVNTVTTPPTTPASYPISNTLSGTYTVGAAGNFTTITAAVNAYNTSCLGGAVVFSLIDATYPGETFPINILANPQSSAVNTLTIKPALTTAVSGSSATGIFMLNGADFVTIDGSTGNTPNTVCPASAATRDLTITNTNAVTTAAVVWLGTTAGGDAVTNCAVQNCVLSGASPATTIVGLGAGGATIGTGGTSNNNISFVNNDVRACQFAIYSSGASAAVKNQNLTINQNFINSVAPNNILQGGIYSAFTNNVTISGNTVGNVINTASADVFAINVGFGAAGGFTATGTGIADGVTNATITNNIVGIVTQSGTFSAAGIGLGNTISGTSLIANNMVSGVAANGTSGDFAGGIVLGGGTGTVNVFYNTVSMQGTMPGATAGSQVSACLGITAATSPTAMTIRNNILSNTQIGNTGATTRFVAIGYGFAGPFTGVSSNYNDFVSVGAGPGTYFVGTTGLLVGGTTAATVAAWQTATSGDANSVGILPVFTSATDLHLVPASNTALDGLGTPVSVTTDIDCATRSATPDMGADEFDLPLCTGTPTPGTATISLTSICQGVTTNLGNTGFTTGVAGITFQWQTSTTPGGPYSNIAGATTANYAYSTAPAGVSYIVCRVTCTNSGLSAITNELTLTVTASPVTSVTPTSGQICLPGGAPITLTASATGGTGVVNFTWTPTTGLAPITGSPVVANPVNTTTYTVTGTDANLCSSTATATITVGATVTIASVTATPTTLCAGNTTALDVTASSAFGPNYAITTVPFVPIASGTGTTTLASAGTATTPLSAGTLDDGYWNGITIPFNFNYFGTFYSTLNVGTNGYVSFSPITTTTGYASTPQIPNVAVPNNIIGGCFGDLEWGFGGVVSTYTSGLAPNRIFVINFNGTTGGGFYAGGAAPTALTTFQVQLYEGSNLIQVQTTNVTSAITSNHTMGIENLGGTAGFVATGRNNSLWSLTNDGTQFAPSGNLTYAWSPSLGLTPSATVKNPTSPALASNTTYTVTVTDATGCSATGNVAVTVTPTVTPSVTITAVPGNVICAGTSVTFTAVGVNGGTTPAYQWKKNGTNVGTNSTTYTDPGLVNGDLITCVLTSNAVCPSPATATSNTITMTVNPLLTPTISIAAVPGTTICAGTNVTFTATITNGGSTPVYQWKKNGGNVGANSATYADAGLANGDLITCELTSNAVCATPASVTSNTLTMTVNPVLTPSVTISALPGVTICTGTTVNFTAVPTNGGATPIFQWKKNGGNVGTNSTTYSDNGLVNGDVITCELTSNAVCATPLTATSNTLTINVVTNTVPTVTITASPGTTICPGTSATFTAVAVNSGITPSYQWKLNAGNVGTNSTTYTNGTLVTGDVVTCVVTSSDPCALPTTGTSNSITMTVADLTNPVAVCQPVTVSLNAGGTGSTTAAAVNNGSSDNCTAAGSLGLALSTTSFACAQLGTNTVTLTVTDAAARTGTCTAVVTVVDAIVPTITCPAPQTLVNTTGQCAAVATFTTPVGADNCTPTTTQIAGLASGASFPVGVTTNTFRVTDAASNSATCSFTVTVTDSELPAITCPANVAVSNDAAACAAIVTYAAPVGTDNCPLQTTLQTAGLASGASFPVGVTTNAFRVTDAVGNSATCSFTVTVTDTEVPAIACPANIVVSNDPGVCDAVVTYTTPAGTDNCSATTALTAGNASGASFPGGVTTVTFTATDGASNTATCSFTVTVDDTELPTLSACPGNITASTSPTSCDTVVNWTAPTATDNCPSPSLISSNAPGSVFGTGTTTVVYTVTDASGNTATCSFDVTVADAIAPTAICQGVTVTLVGGTASTTAAAVDNGSSDACGNVTLSLSQTTFTCANAGANTVVLTVTDGNGNTATCSAVVTVLTQPVTSSATSAVIDCGFNVSCNGATDGTATATGGGGCAPYTFAWSNGQTTNPATGLGAGVVTVTVTDAAGGTSVATVTLTQPTAVTATVNGTTSTCVGQSSGGVDITPDGGNTCLTYSFAWSNGATTEDLSGVAAGTYTVTVTDGNGCTGTQTATVSNFAAPTPSFTVAGPVLTSGQVWVTYQWQLNGNNIAGATASTFTASVNGSYTLVVTDANGCTGTSTAIDVIAIAAADPTVGFIGLSIYPNPARGEFKLLTEQPITQSLTVNISDMYGHRLVEKFIPSLAHDIVFDINAYSAGNYLVEVVSKTGQRKVFRLVVQ